MRAAQIFVEYRFVATWKGTYTRSITAKGQKPNERSVSILRVEAILNVIVILEQRASRSGGQFCGGKTNCTLTTFFVCKTTMSYTKLATLKWFIVFDYAFGSLFSVWLEAIDLKNVKSLWGGFRPLASQFLLLRGRESGRNDIVAKACEKELLGLENFRGFVLKSHLTLQKSYWPLWQLCVTDPFSFERGSFGKSIAPETGFGSKCLPAVFICVLFQTDVWLKLGFT